MIKRVLKYNGDDMKKITFEYVLMYMEFTFIGVFLLIMLCYHFNLKSQTFFSRNLFTENAACIQVTGKVSEDDIVDLQIERWEDYNRVCIYKRIVEEENEIIRGIYDADQVIDYTPYVKQGKFFSDQDFINRERVAVVGSDIENQLIERDGRRYYGYNQELYEVIGIFQKNDTVLDKTIFLNLTYLLEKENNSGVYYLDAKNKNDVEESIQTLYRDTQSQCSMDRINYEFDTSYGLDSESDTLFGCSILASVLQLFLITIFFINRQNYQIAVKRFVGMNKWELFSEYSRKIMIVLIFSLFTIAGCMILVKCFLQQFISLEQITVYHVLALVVIQMTIAFFITIELVRLSDKIHISEALKGRW